MISKRMSHATAITAPTFRFPKRHVTGAVAITSDEQQDQLLDLVGTGQLDVAEVPRPDPVEVADGHVRADARDDARPALP